MTSPPIISIDGIQYKVLGDSLENLQTHEVVKVNALSGRNIDLGSGNDLRGLKIGSKDVTINLCPNFSSKTWSNISKIVLFIGSALLLTGIAVIITHALPIEASISFIAAGIILDLAALLKLYSLIPAHQKK